MYRIYVINENRFVDKEYTQDEILSLIWNNSEFRFLPKFKYVNKWALKRFSFGENDLYTTEYDYIYTAEKGGVYKKKEVPKLFRIYDQDNRIVPPHIWKELMMNFEEKSIKYNSKPKKKVEVMYSLSDMPQKKDHR